MLAIPSTLLWAQRFAMCDASCKILDSVFNNQTESRWWGHLNHYLKKAHKTGPSNIQGDTFEGCQLSIEMTKHESWTFSKLKIKFPVGQWLTLKKSGSWIRPKYWFLLRYIWDEAKSFSIWKSWLLCSSSSVLNMSFSFVAVTSHSETGILMWTEF